MKRGLVLLIAVLLLTSCGHGSLMSSERIAAEKNEKTWQEEYDLGIRYLSEGKYEEAIIAFTTAIKIDSKQAPTYVGRGDAYVLSGETEENLSAAQDDYEKAIELDETDPNAYLGLADVYIRRGEYDTALELLHSALLKTGNDQRIAEKIAEMEDGAFVDSSEHVRRENYYDSNGGLFLYREYVYNNLDELSRSNNYQPDGTLISYSLYSVSEDGLKDYADAYMPDGTLSSRSITVRDENGKYLYTVTQDENGNDLGKTVPIYDGSNEIIQWNDYSPDGTLTGYGRLEGDQFVRYDANGNVLSYGENDD